MQQRKLEDPLRYFKPQEYQEEFWRSDKREIWIFGGNRSGKTLNGAARTIQYLRENPRSQVWACTWASLSVPVQQHTIKNLLPQREVDFAIFTEQNGFTHNLISLNNGSVLRFKTYEQGPESFQGAARDIIWNDEEPPFDIYKEQKARLIDRNGLMLCTMTPVQGLTWVYTEIVEKTEQRKSLEYYFWNTEFNRFINQEAFQDIIQTYSAKEAEVRKKGAFVNLRTGRLYYAYEPIMHKKKIKVDPSLPLRLSFDFNVTPMTTVIGQIRPGAMQLNEQRFVLDIVEVVQNAEYSTQKQCELLSRKLRDWKHQIFIYGDATNPRRTESADVNVTNWLTIKHFFPNAVYKVPNVNPNISERVEWVNAKLMDAGQRIGMYLNEEVCQALDTDFIHGTWDHTGNRKDKSNRSLNHASDALDYIIAQEFPMQPLGLATMEGTSPITYKEIMEKNLSLLH